MTDAPPTHRPATPTAPPSPAEPVAFPQDRTCPYHPPAGYRPLREDRPLSRVSLFDGRTVWVVTGHGDRPRPAHRPAAVLGPHPARVFPMPTARLRRRPVTAGSRCSASTTPSTTPSAAC